jgi:hypothetical protein
MAAGQFFIVARILQKELEHVLYGWLSTATFGLVLTGSDVERPSGVSHDRACMVSRLTGAD